MLETPQGEMLLCGADIYRGPPGGLGLHAHDDPRAHAVFRHTDGLNATQCSYGFPASAITRDGRYWVATPQGLAMMRLPRLARTDRKPVIYIKEITVGRNLQPPGPELVLPPGTHHVELQFDAIDLVSAERIRLQYRLDSVDSEWLGAPTPAHAI